MYTHYTISQDCSGTPEQNTSAVLSRLASKDDDPKTVLSRLAPREQNRSEVLSRLASRDEDRGAILARLGEKEGNGRFGKADLRLLGGKG
jgi:hypothetical protein